jgi:hypothetical protein
MKKALVILGTIHDIAFHSPGGSLMAGLQLGEIIRKAGFNTTIGNSIPLQGFDRVMGVYTFDHGICASACAYAFLGGVTRSYGEKDLYGLHRFGTEVGSISGDEAQVMTSILAQYIERMGANQAILGEASIASFKGQVSVVPVDLAKRMGIIFDNSGQTTFRVEQHEGTATALFDLSVKNKSYSGAIFCANGSSYLAVRGVTHDIPDAFRSMKDYPTEFEVDGGKKVASTASYVGTERRQVVVFKFAQLRPEFFSGSGLKLWMIWNPALKAIDEKKPDFDALTEKMQWVDRVYDFAFTIASENADVTLPLVLRDCLN